MMSTILRVETRIRTKQWQCGRCGQEDQRGITTQLKEVWIREPDVREASRRGKFFPGLWLQREVGRRFSGRYWVPVPKNLQMENQGESWRHHMQISYFPDKANFKLKFLKSAPGHSSRYMYLNHSSSQHKWGRKRWAGLRRNTSNETKGFCTQRGHTLVLWGL